MKIVALIAILVITTYTIWKFQKGRDKDGEE